MPPAADRVTLARRLAEVLARSPLLARGQRLFAANERDWNLPLTKLEKLQAGLYVILRDYRLGHFPPARAGRETSVAAETSYRHSLPGVDQSAVNEMFMRKPFWTGVLRQHLGAYIEVAEALEQLNVRPPQRILELGCGPGWMAEMLALQGYDVVGTSLVDADIELAERRRAAIAAKGLAPTLAFRATPMEEVDVVVADGARFDAVVVYEALHHAFDWQRTIEASHRCLRDGGWLVLCSEPNRVHTFAAYRAARLSGTREIGFSRRELTAQMRRVGFRRVAVLKHRLHLGVRSHWLAAQR